MLDDLAYEVVQLFESRTEEEIVAALPQYKEEDVRACVAEMQSAKDAGDLFVPMEQEMRIPDDGIVKALCLHVAPVSYTHLPGQRT